MQTVQDEELVDGLVAEAVESIENAHESKAGRKAVKAEHKENKRAMKRHTKATKQAAKTAAKEAKAAVEAGMEAPEVQIPAVQHQSAPRITPSKARNAINVAKVVLPAAIPIIAPYAVRAAGAVREAYDKARARKLGVDVESVGEYTGKGAALHVRIAGLSEGLPELRAGGDQQAQRFADESAASLQQLSAAIRAAERMPGARRKEAHRAVARELDELEAQLLRHLGI